MNVQKIAPDGTKLFLKEGRKAGLYHTLKGDNGPIVIVEGYGTASSIHSATGRTAIVTFDAGNLEAVAKKIREINPERPIVIAADDDRELKKNVGVEKAKAAARAVSGKYIAPAFTEEEQAKGMTDFNDLARSRGNRALVDQLSKAKSSEQTMEWIRHQPSSPALKEMEPGL